MERRLHGASLHYGLAICAPYRQARRHVRQMVEHYGQFIEVYVATSLQECEKRDPRRFYKKAWAGEIKNFTGIDDPYEVPEHAEIVLIVEGWLVGSLVDRVLDYLVGEGLLLTSSPREERKLAVAVHI